MHNFLQDVRVALRTLGKNPGFTLVVALSIGMGIGASTAVFTWMDNVLFNPFPVVRESGKLLALNPVEVGEQPRGMRPVPYTDYVEWRAQTRSFTDIALHSIQRMNLRPEGEPQGSPAWAQIVSGNYFSTLELQPQLGRYFSAADESTRTPVVVLSDAFWRRRFGSDTGVLGRQVRLNGASVTIIGVGPQNFTGIISALSFDVWVPVWSQHEIIPQFDWMGNRNVQRMQAFARLKPGVSLAQAQEELRAVALRTSQSFGDAPARTAGIRYVKDTQLGSLLGPLSAAMLVITALVLLTACANVANLLLARATARQKEIAVRQALGASRARIVRELLTQSAVLAVLGGAAGLLLAYWAKDVLFLLRPRVNLPLYYHMEFRPTAVLFAGLVTFLTSMVFGLMPALRASRLDLVPVLKDETRGLGARRSRMRSALVVAQVAFSLVALATAGLFVRSVNMAHNLPLGFGDPDKVLLAGTDMTVAGFDEAGGRAAQQRLLERTRALPGVRSASFATMVPLGFGGHSMFPTKVDGYTPGPQETMLLEKVFISEDYFRTMEIPIVQGRSITQNDQPETQHVAVVNEAFAARYWKGLDPIGRRVDQGEGWATVIGVAKNSTVREFGETPIPVVYQALAQNYLPYITLHARTALDPKAMADTIRREFTAVSPDMPFFDPGTLTENMAASTFVQTLGATMLGSFGGMALLIAAAGIYGVLAYTVAQQRREIAITVALGASPRDVMNSVLGYGMRLTGIGLLVGAVLAMGVGKSVQRTLFGVSPADPVAFATTALLLGTVALAACAVPAWRAMRVDPLIALKSE